MTKPIKIIIADDHALFVQGLKLLLSEHTEFIVEATVKSGKDLLDVLNTLVPDIVLLDINMPDLSGLEVLQLLRNANSSFKTIILSTYNENHLVEKAKSLGAHGYLLKTTNSDQLAEAIKKIYDGDYYYISQKNTSTIEFNTSVGRAEGVKLTKRELEILKYIKADLTNAKIAETLNLSIYTIETHRKNIMQKLGLKTPAALMRFILTNDI